MHAQREQTQSQWIFSQGNPGNQPALQQHLLLTGAACCYQLIETSAHAVAFVLQCPYSMVIPVMQSGMQFAMMFGQQAQEL